jgi:hypothetical protein
MKNIKNFNEFTNENYKSDEDIASEFSEFKMESIIIESRDMSYMYLPNTFEGTIYWEFPYGDEHVGGGSDTTMEDFIYNTDNCTFYYTCNNWYPTETYNKMIEIIKEKLKEEYNKDFKNLKHIEFIRLNEN